MNTCSRRPRNRHRALSLWGFHRGVEGRIWILGLLPTPGPGYFLPWSCGTVTVVAFVEELPDTSFAEYVIV